MFGIIENGTPVLTTLAIIKVSVITIGLVGTHWMMRNTTVLQVALNKKWWMVSIVWALLLIMLIISQESSSSFIYFQF